MIVYQYIISQCSMTLETNNSLNETKEALKKIFSITEIPVVNPNLLDHSVTFSKEIALQLFLYSNKKDWEWYENLDKFCGDKKIDSIIEAIYVYIRNPAFTLDDDELSMDLRIIYEEIINRLSGEN